MPGLWANYAVSSDLPGRLKILDGFLRLWPKWSLLFKARESAFSYEVERPTRERGLLHLSCRCQRYFLFLSFSSF